MDFRVSYENNFGFAVSIVPAAAGSTYSVSVRHRATELIIAATASDLTTVSSILKSAISHIYKGAITSSGYSTERAFLNDLCTQIENASKKPASQLTTKKRRPRYNITHTPCMPTRRKPRTDRTSQKPII